MGRLVYSVIASVDGYVVDAAGSFDWAAPDEEVHAYVNELERPVGTYLYGRRMYEVMSVWHDMPGIGSMPATVQEYAEIWQDADKVVFSSTLAAVTTPRTRLERGFDAVAVRGMVSASARDVSVGGPALAAQALRAGIVDDVHVIAVPVAVGGGTPAWPEAMRVQLELVDERRFGGGAVHLHYRLGA